MANRINAMNPYVGECRETDPLVMRVPMHNTDIGARPSTIKESNAGRNGEMALSHVGGTTSGKK